MTGLLKDTMRERADAQTPPPIDVDLLVRAGDRRIRRSRVTTGLAAAGVAGTLAVGALLGPQLVDGSTTGDRGGVVAEQGREAAGPFAERRPTYAVDATIHYGDTTIDVGETVGSFVQTDDGFVYATDDGRIHLADGESTAEIGRTSPDGLYLKADDTGSLVAWMEFTKGLSPELVVFDTAKREEVARTDEGTGPAMQAFRDTDAAYVYAVDDGTVYWRNADGVMALDVARKTSELLLDGAGAFDISDVANGHFAHVSRQVDGEDTPIRVSTDLAHPSRPLPSGWEGYLSPGARYISTDQADELAVFDVATREDVTPDTLGYEFVAAYAWLDDSTVTLIGIRSLGGGEQPIDILDCDVPQGHCEVAVDGAATYSEEGPPPIALPVGERLG